ARIALFQTAALSVARLATLFEPTITELRPFLADGAETDSGAMILEYVAHSALADLRQRAAPAAIGVAVLSRGVEEHASFSTQAARSGGEALSAYEVVLSCELVAAVRALSLRGLTPAGGTLQRAYTHLSALLDSRTEDRPLDDDLALASEALPTLAAM
ncbi:MAG: aromatic amino acid lyase, partial [Egibacteraceae bacterium]